MDNEFKNYEIGFLVKEESDTQEIAKIISDYNATILNQGQIKKIQLAYPIKKEMSAYFGYLSFSMSPQIITKLNDSLKINPKILRLLIITPSAAKTTAPPAKPTKRIPLIQPTKSAQFIKKAEPTQTLSNEALEKKLEEILK